MRWMLPWEIGRQVDSEQRDRRLPLSSPPFSVYQYRFSRQCKKTLFRIYTDAQ
jgi:hypothetical protein